MTCMNPIPLTVVYHTVHSNLYERNFHTPAVRICVLYDPNSALMRCTELYLSGRYRSAIYTTGTNPIPLKVVHHTRAQQSVANGIFGDLLYGSVEFHEVGPEQCT